MTQNWILMDTKWREKREIYYISENLRIILTITVSSNWKLEFQFMQMLLELPTSREVCSILSSYAKRKYSNAKIINFIFKPMLELWITRWLSQLDAYQNISFIRT